jgi:hypothetical protein
MAGTRRAAYNATIWIDTSSAGTMPIGTLASGTSNLSLITSKNSWSFDQSRDLIEVTSFGDTSKTRVAGLADAQGDITGYLDFADTNLYTALTSSTERAIIIFPDATNNLTTFIIGKAFFSPKYGGQETSAVTLDITYSAGPSGMSLQHP